MFWRDGTGTIVDNDSDDDEAGCQDATACNYKKMR